MTPRTAGIVVALMVAVAIAGGAVEYLIWRHNHAASSGIESDPLTPYRKSPVMLEVYNGHGTSIAVSGFAGDRAHVIPDGGMIRVSSLTAPAPWHAVISDAGTKAVLFDEQLPAGTRAVLHIGPHDVERIASDNADEGVEADS
jgi:hypothetical protein